MSEAQIALDAALEAHRQGSAAVAAARDQLQTAVTRRAEAATALQAAKAALREASAALAKGGGEKAFHSAAEQVSMIEARCRALGDLEDETRASVTAAEDAMPCGRHLAALQLRVRAQADLLPLYEQHANLMAAQAEILAKVEEAHAALSQEFRGAYPTLFSPNPSSFLGDLLKAVPPGVRAFSRHLFTDYVGNTAHEHRFLQHDPEALTKFNLRLDQEPSAAEIAKFNGAIYQAYTPPPPSEPRPKPGPAKMRSVVLSTPGAI